MVIMTLEEAKKLPPLSEKEIEEIKNFKNTDFSDCPIQTDEELKQFRPWRELHPEFYKPTKTDVHLKIDTDVLNYFKSQGKGYQTKINAVLREFALTRA